MNSERYDHQVTELLAKARHASSPREILKIAHRLEGWSAWEAARECERLAEAAERKLAEAVNK